MSVFLRSYEIEHVKRLRAHLPECMVLLKSNGDFPLSAPGRLALFGSGARHTVKGGTGSGDVNSRYFVTVEQGLSEAGFVITSGSWLDAYDVVLAKQKEEHRRQIWKTAVKEHTNPFITAMGDAPCEPEYEIPLIGGGETCIYVVGRISGEGSDRKTEGGDLRLTETEIRDIHLCREKYLNFMLVINAGGPVDLSSVNDVENILVLSQLGVETGAALADVLLGKANPSGKLATTWACGANWQPLDFGDRIETRYTEGIFVGYRYYDTAGVAPLYPFGYGLSYTRFLLGDVKAAVSGETVSVSVPVLNAGERDGKEVVQVYVSKPAGKLPEPYQVLAGFAKTASLTPGAEETVAVSFAMSELSSYDSERACFVLPAGDYVVRVGSSSRDTNAAAVLHLDREVVTRVCKNAGGTPDFTDAVFFAPVAIPQDVPVLTVDPETIPCEKVCYEKKWHINRGVEKLSDEELALLNVGAFDPKSGIAGVIGESGKQVAGTAGETASILNLRGFPSLVMADGPAGLRISREYVIDKKGNAVGVGNSLPNFVTDLLPEGAQKPLSMMTKKAKKKEVVGEQYCTAIPIGTALAQSFNLALIEDCGDIVGREMELFGIHLWLAPALNIHRSILCGRNFEYYSEDPLVSGRVAAAMTRGVQKHPGCGTTIKHYCANNQETNRYGSNSGISERALREIYLKGFEICVKEAQPCALMTSYNLLNGVHTSERRDLLEDVLRCEFGFRGIVMTDWVVSGYTDNNDGYPSPNAAKVAAAGHELFMPGSRKDYEDILAGLSEGTVSRKQLEINASRLCRMARKLTKEHPEGTMFVKGQEE